MYVLVLIYTPIRFRFLSGILVGGMFGAVAFAAGAGDLTGVCWQSMNAEIKHEKGEKGRAKGQEDVALGVECCCAVVT